MHVQSAAETRTVSLLEDLCIIIDERSTYVVMGNSNEQ
jgi:hypothetical protein